MGSVWMVWPGACSCCFLYGEDEGGGFQDPRLQVGVSDLAETWPSARQSFRSAKIWVVLKIMGPFGYTLKLRRLIFRGTKRGP